MNKKISVVMSVYSNDKAIHFKHSVESLLNQTYKPSEIIIIVDGKVPTKIEELLNYYKENNIINIIWLEENKGLANALNVGISRSKHELIARMDSDDICFEDRLEKQLKHLTENNLDFIGGQMIEFGNDKKDIISYRKVPVNHVDIVKYMKFRAPFSHPTVLFKKEVFIKLNGYDVNIFPEDYDFFVRVYLNGFKMGNLNENVLWFRLGANLSEALKRRWGKSYAKNEYKLYKKYFKLGFYNRLEFFKAILFKIPLRLLPFPVFKFIYFKMFR
tara:strand:+ start:7121 stop:7939 length:819 start_codon:yes stop_codon:yes gene_type:complete